MTLVLNKNKTQLLFGYMALGLAAVILLFRSELIKEIITYISQHVSEDGELEFGGVSTIYMLVYGGVFICLLLGAILLFDFHEPVIRYLYKFIDTQKLRSFLFDDHLPGTHKNLSKFVVFASIPICIFLHGNKLLFGEPRGETPMELFSSLFFLFSALLLIGANIRLNRIKNTDQHLRHATRLFWIIAFFLLLIFGEEYSWGQTIFKWKSFGVFEEFNIQQETNLHNFFNPLFKIAYPIAGTGFFLVLFALWFFPNKENLKPTNLIVPHKSLIFITISLIGSSYNGQSEFFEELLVSFFFFYSLRVFMYSGKHRQKTMA